MYRSGFGDFEVKALIPTQVGRQKATLIATQKIAEKLLKEGGIKIGWMRCKVELSVEVKKYYKFWDYGHVAAKRKGPVRTSLCLKCANEGHVARACNNTARCPLCEKEGYQAGAQQCAKFKKTIAEVLKTNKNNV